MTGIGGIRPGQRRAATSKIGQTAPLDPDATRKLTQKIKAAVSYSPAEQVALSRLSPEQRKQYATVASRLGPVDRQALLDMLQSGKLASGRDLQGGADLLGNLANLATEPMGPGIDRKAVLSQAIQGVANPSGIKQGDALTCGAATTQIMLAKDNPSEYVRILAGLASKDGRVQLANGATISRQPGFDQAAIPGAASQLMQTSFMAFAAGGYDAASDTRTDGRKGLFGSEQGFLQEAVLGKAVSTLEGNSDEVMARIGQAANAGKGVSVLVEGEGGGHYVQVTGVKDGKVTYVDPKDGKAREVDAASFQKSVRAANVESDEKRPLRKERPTDEKGILGGGCGVVKSIGKAIGGAVKSVGKAVGKAVKSTVGAVVDAAKSVGKFVKKNFSYIVMAAQIACMFVPGLQVVSLALAAYQAAKAAPQLYNGIKNGDWKQALGGVAGMAGAFAGGVGALGAKAVSAGVQTAANVAGTVSRIANAGVGVANAIQNKNWGGLVSGAAGLAASGLKFVGDGAAATAEKFAGYARKLDGVYQGVKHKNFEYAIGSGLSLAGDIAAEEKGADSGTVKDLAKAGQYVAAAGNVRHAVKNRDGAAIAGAAAGLVATGADDLASGQTAKGLKEKAGFVQKALDIGSQVAGAARKYGTGAVAAVLGVGAAGAGIRYLTMSDEERQQAREAAGDLGKDFASGNFDKVGKDAATLIGIGRDGSFASTVGQLAGTGSKVRDVVGAKKTIDQQVTDLNSGIFDYGAQAERQQRFEKGVSGFTSLFGLESKPTGDSARGDGQPASPPGSQPLSPGTSRLHAYDEPVQIAKGRNGGKGTSGYKPEEPPPTDIA